MSNGDNSFWNNGNVLDKSNKILDDVWKENRCSVSYV